jgi:hypothetical protein
MELDGLASRQGAEGHVILPVWDGVTADDVRRQSPVLAGLVAADMKTGFESVVESLHRVLYRKKYKPLVGVSGGCPKCRKGTLRRCVQEGNIDEPLLFYECDYCEFVCEKMVIDVFEEKERGDARRDLHKRIQEWEKRQRDEGAAEHPRAD